MTLIEKMVMYRAKHNLSQAKFAKLCGLSVMTINSIENGTQDPTPLTQAKIKLVLEGINDEAVSQSDKDL